ncbi:MAG: MFS transporter [Ginsengibacter sp.]
MNIQYTFRALKSRNFALFFFGQFVSRVGMWMQRTAVIWVVYSITHSAFMIGVATFAEQFPSFIFSVRGGLIADRYNRYKVLMLTQTLSALQAIALTVFTFSGNYNIALILGLSAFLGIVNAYDVPVRQSMINEIIGKKEDLTNGIALNATLNMLARLIGPALAGFVLVKYGADYCFLFNAVSFLAVIGAIAAMRFPKNIFMVHKTKSKAKFKEALDYLAENKPIANVIWIAALSSFLVLPYVTLLPVYAKVIFHGDAATYGWLNAAIGLGAFAGTFYLASLHKETDLRKVLLVNIFVGGISLLLFSYCDNLYLSLFFAMISGLSAILQSAVIMTIVQSETADKFRGRVVSLIAMAMFGMLPLGSLLIGYLAPIVGAPLTLFGEGILGIIIGMVFYKNLMNTSLTLKKLNNGK